MGNLEEKPLTVADQNQDSLPHPAPQGVTIYHWHGGLLLLARTLVLTRPTSPIAATLRIALDAPYTIDVEGQTLVTYASLVAPKRERRRVVALQSDIALLYLPIERPEYTALRQRLGAQALITFERTHFAAVLPRLRQAFDGALTAAEVKALAVDTLALVAGPLTVPRTMDERIHKICARLAVTPLDQQDIERLAAEVHLSPAWLRALFKREVGSSIGEYGRWCATWQAVGHWKPGRSFTEASMEAGFFDLAHIDKTFAEVFGMSPSLATDERFVRLIHCD